MKRVLVTIALLLTAGVAARAQEPTSQAASVAADDQHEDDTELHAAEPDYTIVSLPTSLRLPHFKSAFRVTHRFARPLRGNFGDVAGDLFGLDSGAQIGLEYRFGIVPAGEIGIHRTSDKTLEFFGQYGLVRQGPAHPLDVTILASIEGTNNFEDQYTPALGAIVSRRFSERAAAYAEPIWVRHANVQPSFDSEASDTFLLGVGGRVRVRPTVSVVAEFAPRLSGYRPDVHHASVAIEKRVGGHVFQLNFSNSFATTMGQIARGGAASEDWYLGFNISRKFF
jgi:hypothetical protein